jgi:hypothetical protein
MPGFLVTYRHSEPRLSDIERGEDKYGPSSIPTDMSPGQVSRSMHRDIPCRTGESRRRWTKSYEGVLTLRGHLAQVSISVTSKKAQQLCI